MGDDYEYELVMYWLFQKDQYEKDEKEAEEN